VNDRDRGLYGKYHIIRLGDEIGKHAECDYFVLDLVHDKHARMALSAYAVSCADEFPFLSRDLLDRLEEPGFGAIEASGS
jgi:hypothetical protein